MPTVFAFTPKFQAFTSGGALANGYKLFAYAAGTSTKQNTYTDSTGNSANTNPVVLDSRGEANVWLDTTLLYKLLLTLDTEADPPINNIWSVDSFGVYQAVGSFTSLTVSSTGAAGGPALTVQDLAGAYQVVGANCLNNAATPTTQFDMDCDWLKLTQAGDDGTKFVNNPATITNNVLTAGPAANGRDQAGVFSASSWIHFYWIYNPTTSTLASTSSATGPPTGPALPTGYTHWAYCCTIRFNASSQLIPSYVKNDFVGYDAEQAVLLSGTAGTETAVDLAAFIPPVAKTFQIHLLHALAGGGGAANEWGTRLRVKTAVTLILVQDTVIASATTGVRNHVTPTIPNVGQNMYYLVALVG